LVVHLALGAYVKHIQGLATSATGVFHMTRRRSSRSTIPIRG